MIPAFLLAGCSPASVVSPLSKEPVSSSAVASEPHRQQNGSKSVFESSCLVCHAAGSPRGMDVLVKQSARFSSQAAFLAYVRHPGLGMPAFSPEQLSDEELQQLYTYLKKEYGAN
ncbi:MAG: c-type cytochrome [Vampirovibrionales bacterium]|nr:c-type cytochrome [Vampirovibrionales bacterium]